MVADSARVDKARNPCSAMHLLGGATLMRLPGLIECKALPQAQSPGSIPSHLGVGCRRGSEER